MQDNDKKAKTGKTDKPAKPGKAKSQPNVIADTPMRIAKRLARVGVCSRRDAERWIEAGRVSVNGKVLTSPALNVTLHDKIEVDGNPLPQIEQTRLWMFHKKSGLVTTDKDPEGRSTVFSALPKEMPRVLSIGRLDINTEGLLLLTNDGGLARVLELPSTGWLRRYRVRAHGKITQPELDKLKDGIAVEGVLYGSIEAELEREQGTNVWLTLAFREGKNREVKKVLGALGLEVNRLIRVSYGPFQLGELGPGELQEIRSKILRDQLGERLIKQANANFDAPKIHFMNQPEAKKPAATAPKRNVNRKKLAAAKKQEALSRLDTKPQSLDAKTGKRKFAATKRGGSTDKAKPARGRNADRRR